MKNFEPPKDFYLKNSDLIVNIINNKKQNETEILIRKKCNYNKNNVYFYLTCEKILNKDKKEVENRQKINLKQYSIVLTNKSEEEYFKDTKTISNFDKNDILKLYLTK